MEFWKEHMKLRSLVILIFVILGIAATFVGWKMTGEMTGLLIMMVGVIFLLTALMVYNKPFEEPKKKKRKG